MAKRGFRIAPFLTAFFAAPLLVTALTSWITFVPLAALYLGGPIYVLVGLPVLWAYLRRHPPNYLPILLRALISVLCVLPLTGFAAWWARDAAILEALPFFMTMGALFAGAWSLTFTTLYRLLIGRDAAQ